MHFRSCFLFSTLWVFGFPIAVPKERNSDETLSVRDDALASEDPPDLHATSPPPTGLLSSSWTSGGGDITSQPVSNGAKLSSDSPGSTLLAQTVYDNGDGVDPFIEAILGGLGAGAGLFLDRNHEVNRVFQDDHPNVKVTDINPFIKNPPKEDDKGGAATLPGKATPSRATDTGETDAAAPCPPVIFGERIVPWCDGGIPGSVFYKDDAVCVNGYHCMLFFSSICPIHSQFPFVSFSIIKKINHFYRNSNVVRGVCRKPAYQEYWCCVRQMPGTSVSTEFSFLYLVKEPVKEPLHKRRTLFHHKSLALTEAAFGVVFLIRLPMTAQRTTISIRKS